MDEPSSVNITLHTRRRLGLLAGPVRVVARRTMSWWTGDAKITVTVESTVSNATTIDILTARGEETSLFRPAVTAVAVTRCLMNGVT
jgi:hypothetical protein